MPSLRSRDSSPTQCSTPCASTSATVSPSTPAAPPLRRTSAHAASRKSSRQTLSTRAWKRRPGSSFAFACSTVWSFRTLTDPVRLAPVVMSLPPFRTAPNSGPLPSTGITPRPRYYGPIRHPAGPACPSRGSGCRVATAPTGLPVLPRIPPSTRADATTPAGTSRLSRRSLPGRSAAFPFLAEGRLPRLMFRGLLGVHSRFGPHGRWASYRLSSSLGRLRRFRLRARLGCRISCEALLPECFGPCRYLHAPLWLLPAGATVAGRDSHPLGTRAFPRRTQETI